MPRRRNLVEEEEEEGGGGRGGGRGGATLLPHVWDSLFLLLLDFDPIRKKNYNCNNAVTDQRAV